MREKVTFAVSVLLQRCVPVQVEMCVSLGFPPPKVRLYMEHGRSAKTNDTLTHRGCHHALILEWMTTAGRCGEGTAECQPCVHQLMGSP